MKNGSAASLFPNYEKLLQDLEALCRALAARYGPEIRCGKGCSSCCTAGLSVFPVEAWYIRKNIPASFTGNPGTKSCIFLKDGLCTVYHARPVLCRTQGFPLLYRQEINLGDGDTGEISACSLNFTGIREFSTEHVIDMEKVNLPLVAVNIRFLHDAGRYEEYKHTRFLMEDIPLLEW